MSKLKISFDFDPATNKVTNVTVSGAEFKTSKPKATTKTADKSAALVKLDGNNIKMTAPLMNALGVTVGDKVSATLLSDCIIQLDKSDSGTAITKTKTLNIRKLVAEKALAEEYTFSVIDDGTIHLICKEEKQDDFETPEDIQADIDEVIEEDLGDKVEDFDFNFDNL